MAARAFAGPRPRGHLRQPSWRIWLLLFGVYAATLPIVAFARSDYGGDEPHYLLAAESIVSDGDVDLTDEYAGRDYAAWYPYDLEPHGEPTDGRIHEPHGVGFPLLIATPYWLGGPVAVELFLAAIAALGFVAALGLARRLVPEPWATRGVLVCALSPPALAYGTAVYPEMAAGAVLAASVLIAVRTRETPRAMEAYLAAALLATLPWLGTKFAIAGAVVAFVLVRWLFEHGRRVVGIVAAELLVASLLFYGQVNRVLYDGSTPYAADRAGQTATDAAFPLGYLERVPRLAALWTDREYGLLRWAPVFALAFLAAWLLWRSRRSGIAKAIPERAAAERCAALLLAVCAAQVVVAAFGAPTMFGFWFPPRHLVAALPVAAALAAWGLRYAPRAGGALCALTILASGWLYAELVVGSAGGWVAPSSDAPLGPLVAALPLYGTDSAYAAVVAALLAAGVLGLVVFEALRARRSSRQTAGTTRRAYSG